MTARSSTKPDSIDPPGDPPGEELSLDSLYHVLQNERRRLTLRYLVDTEQTDLGSITDQVAAWEHGTTIDELPSDQRKRVYISLYQSHLPTLAEHNVIDYDRESNVVTPLDTLSRFEPYLDVSRTEHASDTDDGQHQIAILATVLSVSLVMFAVGRILTGPLSLAIPILVTGAVGVAIAHSNGFLS